MKQAILDQIKSTKQILDERFGITQIAIFGSYARGEETDESDLDIVILEMKRKNGLIVVRAKNFLQEYLNKKVDIGFYNSMNPFIKKQIEKDMVYV